MLGGAGAGAGDEVREGVGEGVVTSLVALLAPATEAFSSLSLVP